MTESSWMQNMHAHAHWDKIAHTDKGKGGTISL